jgi:hypothetical protein
MTRLAFSILVFGIYLALLGALLAVAPNLLLGLGGIPPVFDVYIHLAGMLILILSFYYIMAARSGFTPFFRWTIAARLAAGLFLAGSILAGLAKPVILLFWLAGCERGGR